MTTESQTPGQHLAIVLDQLSDLVGQVGPEQFPAPTPCPDFDVAALRSHILGWAQFFAVAFEQPDGTGDRPDPDGLQAPAEPAEAAAVLRDTAGRIRASVEGGLAEQEVTMFGGAMPGSVPLSMCLAEYLLHGHDLAQGAGLPWNPPGEAVGIALEFLPNMLTDDYRGPDKSFGYPVEVPESASDLDKLVAFSGRDPYWKAV